MLDLKKIFLEDYAKYIVLDTEACNLNLVSRQNLPWQISWIECKGKFVEKEENHYLWWENLRLSPGAALVTHFNYGYYKSKAVDPKPIAEKFKAVLDDKNTYIVWQNGLRYDDFTIRNWFEACGVKHSYDYLERSIDTSCLSKAMKEEIKFPRDGDLLEWQFKLANHIRKGLKTSVGVMCKELDIPIDETKQHDALYDIEMTKEIFIKLLYKLS
jgi:DNA polymerase III epsilon subunit-like protein